MRSVEVKVDDGAWRPAAMDSSNTKYSWKLFSYMWNGATPGEHTLVSRVTDENGNVQRESLTLQEGLKKAFQHLQSNQKNYRREIHPAHGRENAPDRLQQRFGKPVYNLDSRIVIWELEPREYDRDENDQ